MGSADNDNFSDIYVRDMAAGTTVLASRADGAGDVGNGNSHSPSIAGNGSSVAFESGATEFDNEHDSDTASNVYRRSLTANTTALVTSPPQGRRATSRHARRGRLRRRRGFVSSATVLDPDDPDPRRDAYVKNLATSEIQVAGRLDGANGTVANAASPPWP